MQIFPLFVIGSQAFHNVYFEVISAENVFNIKNKIDFTIMTVIYLRDKLKIIPI